MVHVMLVLLVAAQAVRLTRREGEVEMAQAVVGNWPALPKLLPVTVSSPPVVAKRPPAGAAMAVTTGTACTTAITATVAGATPTLVGPEKSVSCTLTQTLKTTRTRFPLKP